MFSLLATGRRVAVLVSLVFSQASLCPSTAGPLSVGSTAPEIQATGWLNGGPVTLASRADKVTVVEFFATWCPPCRKSAPKVIALNQKIQARGGLIVSLSDEDQATVDPYVKELGINYPVGVGSNSDKDYGIEFIPHAFVVKNGKILFQGHPEKGLEAALEEALSGGGSATAPTSIPSATTQPAVPLDKPIGLASNASASSETTGSIPNLPIPSAGDTALPASDLPRSLANPTGKLPFDTALAPKTAANPTGSVPTVEQVRSFATPNATVTEPTRPRSFSNPNGDVVAPTVRSFVNPNVTDTVVQTRSFANPNGDVGVPNNRKSFANPNGN